MKLKLEVTGQQLRIVAGAPVVSDAINYVDAECTFSSDWEGLDKWLHLKSPGGQTYDVELDRENRAYHLNLSAGLWTLWMHGHEITGVQPQLRITTAGASLRVLQSGAPNGRQLPEMQVSTAEQIAANAAYARLQTEDLRRSMDRLERAAAEVEDSVQLVIDTGKEVGSLRTEIGQDRAAVEQTAEQVNRNLAVTGSMVDEVRVQLKQALPGLDKLPYPDGETGTWWCWSREAGGFEDTGRESRGPSVLAPGSLVVALGRDAAGVYLEY